MNFKNKSFFSKSLLQWYDESEKRYLPWKESNSAYHIWLSEIILQQTRVDQGTPYYLKFIEKYPNITDLANDDEDNILKLWQGLGYYARARNMHKTAKQIRDNYLGIFPKTYKEIRSLQGVGDYTAAAISSFAYGLPYAVLDGNVFRVLSRYFDISIPIDNSEGKKLFSNLASELIIPIRSADYNQAIMDLGATICKPVSPLCTQCPLNSKCMSYKLQNHIVRPVKSKKLKKKIRHFYYLFWTDSEGNTVICKRNKKDIWLGLYEFPLIESNQIKLDNKEKLFASDEWLKWTEGNNFEKNIIKFSTSSRQVLTHQNILAIFVEILGEIPINFRNNDNFKIVSLSKIDNFAFPLCIQKYLDTKQNE